MMKTRKKDLKNLIETNVALSTKYLTREQIRDLKLYQIGYSEGMYGCTGKLYQSRVTKDLYVALDSDIYRI